MTKKCFQKSTPSTVTNRLTFGSGAHGLYNCTINCSWTRIYPGTTVPLDYQCQCTDAIPTTFNAKPMGSLKCIFFLTASNSLSRFMSGSRSKLESGSMFGPHCILWFIYSTVLFYCLSYLVKLLTCSVFIFFFIYQEFDLLLHCLHCHGPVEGGCFPSSLRSSPNPKPARRNTITTLLCVTLSCSF